MVVVVIAPNRNLSKCSSVVEWTHWLWYIHTAEYYTAIRMSKIQPYATILLNLLNMILSKVYTIRFHSYKVQKQARFIYGVRSQVNGYLWGELVAGRATRGRFLDDGHVQLLDLSAGSSGALTL